MYFLYGSRDVLQAQCKNLHERVELELDGKVIELPQLEGIVVLNINSWCGGCQIWNNNNEDGTESKYVITCVHHRLSNFLFSSHDFSSASTCCS